MLQDLGGTGHLYRTRPEWSVTEWHWACVICEKNGHDFDSAALALQGFYRHRASVHGLSPAPRELREPPVLLQLTTGVRAAPAQRLGSQAAPGGAGELYRTSAGSGLEWHWSCFVCGESGHELETTSSALRSFYGHRVSAHGFSPAPAVGAPPAPAAAEVINLSRVLELIEVQPEVRTALPDRGAPEWAVATFGGENAPPMGEVRGVPPVSYELVVRACEGADRVPVWLALGGVLSKRPDWQFGISDDGAATAFWTWTAHPEYWATAEQYPDQAPKWELFRQDGDDEESMWELPNPEALPLLAEAIAAGAPQPEAVRLGAWTEEPFLEWMRGEAPPPWERSAAEEH